MLFLFGPKVLRLREAKEMKKDGGPAYPQGHKWTCSGQNPQVIDYGQQGGMSLRDWIAAHAVGQIMTLFRVDGPELAAKLAYAIADAMLAEREK